MSNVTKLNDFQPPVVIHFIAEWADKRGLRQADIVREIGADKGLVSRWFDGTVPKPEYLAKLAALFDTDIHGLFRHPDDDWLARFFRDKSAEQRDQAIKMLKLMFDASRTGTDG